MEKFQPVVDSPESPQLQYGSGQASVDELANAITASSSGRGKESIFPTELKGFNAGAALAGPVWCLGNKVWLGALIQLLILIIWPFSYWVSDVLYIICTVYFGLKGNEWAWRSRKWTSIAQFKDVQNKWSIFGIIYIIFFTLVVMVLALINYGHGFSSLTF